jgi:hypothetical protein
MPYAIVVFDKAWEDITKLVESIPTDRWDAIIEAIAGNLYLFGQIPTTQRPRDLVVPLVFQAGGVQYRWLAYWQYADAKDESTIYITGFSRDPKTTL